MNLNMMKQTMMTIVMTTNNKQLIKLEWYNMIKTIVKSRLTKIRDTNTIYYKNVKTINIQPTPLKTISVPIRC